ncbi:MAG: hypothetical protein HY834_11675 [Devosia nanyangense]|uniref:Uncharacterized protein n=1 Tax=Devosia nanyangense TaxID=1228055 RepID=A0A933NYV2_9HYPH|nr:hypothetical protein [Devosia nanyangense]
MATRDHRVGLWPLAICWALTAAAFGAKAVLSAGTTPLILDTDDAMRLTMVHDFLAGQGWFDLVQHRLNTPYGAEIHWSRLIDLPEAALLVVLRPIAGAMADTIVACAWPLTLLLLLLWLSGKLALRLAGRAALLPALVLPALSLVTMAEFAPGRLDHHSAQILLSLAMLYCTIRSLDRPRLAIGAGAAAATAMAIGIESLPMVVATALVFGLAWVAAPRHAAAMRDFGVSFAVGTALALAQGVPPARWLAPATDAISIVYTVAAGLAGLALATLSLVPLRAWPVRLIAGVAAGMVVAGATLALYPAILMGPYGTLDPWLIANWIDRIAEAQPWWTSLVGDPVYPIAVAVPVLAALATIVWNVVRGGSDRGAWLIYGAFLLVATAVMLLQIRAARIAVPLAIPACAALIATAWRYQAARRGMLPALAFVGSCLVSAGIAVGVLATAIVLAFPDYAAATEDRFRAARQACLQPSAFADLAGLPPERVMAPIDLGSHLLLFTSHAVVAAPYHRNQQGVMDAFRFFNGPIDEGRAILAARGVSLVVICPAMKEIRGLVEHTPDSFVTLFAAGSLPDWLVDRSLPDSPLRVYAVAPR